jgi:hypothetical protein
MQQEISSHENFAVGEDFDAITAIEENALKYNRTFRNDKITIIPEFVNDNRLLKSESDYCSDYDQDMLPEAENEITRASIINEMERVTGNEDEMLSQFATRFSTFPDTSHIISQREEGLPKIGLSKEHSPRPRDPWMDHPVDREYNLGANSEGEENTQKPDETSSELSVNPLVWGSDLTST